ncbi:uncharacterized protein [Blastocystis hominis]|uniref:CCHC-type domain-containing protein n=1 Tax=Blastocystis hominis TaxID=12968 RepID=D8M6C1_BLAHO|nr:uncharacterized protein [Blastocystis hominis]CBK23674.2 unnamed protein product [Blastocystis hominis]|eukprot:XP_012897722.1 uncharacterized protein [Blastocystis hominis]
MTVCWKVSKFFFRSFHYMQRGQTSNNNSNESCQVLQRIAPAPIILCKQLHVPNTAIDPDIKHRNLERRIIIKDCTAVIPVRFSSHRCLVCGKLGHNEHECRFRYQGPQLRKAQTETSTDESTCALCGIHCLAFTICFAHCPNNPRCRRCGEEGHTARKCSNAVLCRNCFQLGHWTRDCTNEPVCANCKETGHKVHECPQLVEQSE